MTTSNISTVEVLEHLLTFLGAFSFGMAYMFFLSPIYVIVGVVTLGIALVPTMILVYVYTRPLGTVRSELHWNGIIMLAAVTPFLGMLAAQLFMGG